MATVMAFVDGLVEPPKLREVADLAAALGIDAPFVQAVAHLLVDDVGWARRPCAGRSLPRARRSGTWDFWPHMDVPVDELRERWTIPPPHLLRPPPTAPHVVGRHL